MRPCLIFNPTARGEKARHFRVHRAELGPNVSFQPTLSPGHATALATEAVAAGFDTIIAAGGDGTVNEVLNGIAAAPGGLEKARLAVLPLGTVNVFARELGLPLRWRDAWPAITSGRERRIDLPFVELERERAQHRRYFAQMAGAGLDARAIELVDWELKKRFSQLAYVWSGLRAMREPLPQMTVRADGFEAAGELVLFGNGRYYGGRLAVFPGASLADGRLDVCVFPRVSWFTLVRYGIGFLTGRVIEPGDLKRFQATSFELSSASQVSLEVDGDVVGALPARVGVLPGGLRVATAG